MIINNKCGLTEFDINKMIMISNFLSVDTLLLPDEFEILVKYALPYHFFNI